jgi:hypothetical protein
MREIWFALVALLSLAGIDPAAAQTPAKPAANAASLLAPTPQDRILGKPDAPITIVEYASLTCPHCAHFDTDVLPKLKEKWIDSGKAKLILRDFPLDEPAMRAAMVARCAPPERFYPLVDALFAGQEKWATAKDYRAALERLAKLGGDRGEGPRGRIHPDLFHQRHQIRGGADRRGVRASALGPGGEIMMLGRRPVKACRYRGHRAGQCR